MDFHFHIKVLRTWILRQITKIAKIHDRRQHSRLSWIAWFRDFGL